jgi:hypothetical protein
MSLFPGTRYPEYGYQAWQEENVTRNEPRAPKLFVKDNWGTTRFRARMRFNFTTDYVLSLYAFWKVNRLVSFDFIDYDFDVYVLDRFRDTNRVILTQTDGNATIEFQAKNVRNVAVFLGGTTIGHLVSSSAYTIAVGTGNDGLDRLTWNAPVPGAGQALYVSHVGQRIFRCRFMAEPRKESISYGRISLTIDVAEDL